MAYLTQQTICGCGEFINVTPTDVLGYDSIECPHCGSDAYHTEDQYNEALSLDAMDLREAYDSFNRE